MIADVMPRVPSAVYEGIEKKKKSRVDGRMSPAASKRFAVDKLPQTEVKADCQHTTEEEKLVKTSGDGDGATLHNPNDGCFEAENDSRKSRSLAESSGSDTGIVGKNSAKTTLPQPEDFLNHSATSSSYGGGANGSLNSSLKSPRLTDESFGLLVASTPVSFPIELVTGEEQIHIAKGTKEFHRAKIASVKRRSRNVRRFHRLFKNVPTTEHLLSRFSCAYVGEMGLLIQGHLYISYNYICFHSRIFGKVIEIEANRVSAVTKEKTARIIPNAVGIKTEDSKYYLFGSLLSRDNTFQILQCVVHKTAPKELLLPPNVESLVNGFDSVVVPAEIIDDQSSSALSTDCSDPSCSSGESVEGTPAVRHRHVRQPDRFQSQPNLDAVDSPVGNRGKRKDEPLHSVNGKVPSKSSGENQIRLQTFITWVLSLPKVILFLFASIFVLVLLFLCATILTFRLMQLQERHSSMANELSWTFSGANSETTLRLEHSIDSVISYLAKAKDQLDQLRKELQLTQTAKFPLWPSKDEMTS